MEPEAGKGGRFAPGQAACNELPALWALPVQLQPGSNHSHLWRLQGYYLLWTCLLHGTPSLSLHCSRQTATVQL